ncbi:MAG: hypothetical protein ACRDWD_08625 [Acidimicrobiia bacterium]
MKAEELLVAAVARTGVDDFGPDGDVAALRERFEPNTGRFGALAGIETG